VFGNSEPAAAKPLSDTDRISAGKASQHMNNTEPPGLPTAQTNGVTHAAQSATAQIQSISFAIDKDQYGVDIMAVRELKGWSEITHLPKQPEYVRGVLNLRGVIVPIIDLRCRFGQGLTETTPLHVVIIVQIGSRQVGLLADRVLDIVSFEPSRVQPVPQVTQASIISFLSGLVTIDNAMLALIDLPNLLTATTAEIKANAAALH
jgi:purine-binding chemotaxis protein CheW